MNTVKNLFKLIGTKLLIAMGLVLLAITKICIKIRHPFQKVDTEALGVLFNQVNSEISENMAKYYSIAEKALSEGKGPTAIGTEVLMAMGKTMNESIAKEIDSLNKVTLFSMEYRKAVWAEVDHLSKWSSNIADVVIAKANNVAEA